jgi:hypothetical protein
MIGSEYHIIPKNRGNYGNYNNSGHWGSEDSYSTLAF